MNDELKHFGIKGMKWGVRKYQNSDGSLTPAGKKRYYDSDGNLTDAGKKNLAKNIINIQKTEKDENVQQSKTLELLNNESEFRNAVSKLKNTAQDHKNAFDEMNESEDKYWNMFDKIKNDDNVIKKVKSELPDDIDNDHLDECLDNEVYSIIDSNSQYKKIQQRYYNAEDNFSNAVSKLEHESKILTQQLLGKYGSKKYIDHNEHYKLGYKFVETQLAAKAALLQATYKELESKNYNSNKN